MNVKTIVAILAFFCLFSCAPVKTGLSIEGNTLSSDRPRLDIHFKKEIFQVKELENESTVITFRGGDPRPMMIQLHRVPHSTKIDYFLSLREIASNLNFYYLDGIMFGEKEWAKTAYYDGESGWLMCGYLTNMDNDFILVSVVSPVVEDDVRRTLIEYKKTTNMSAEALSVINDQFFYFDQLAEIR
ncbi:MAG TPA: hypothetical protein DDY32_16915 [Desulfobulbaceae bacterium]|nr:hypothetical protein [Desulfobulbaceae bacterium]